MKLFTVGIISTFEIDIFIYLCEIVKIPIVIFRPVSRPNGDAVDKKFLDTGEKKLGEIFEKLCIKIYVYDILQSISQVNTVGIPLNTLLQSITVFNVAPTPKPEKFIAVVFKLLFNEFLSDILEIYSHI